MPAVSRTAPAVAGALTLGAGLAHGLAAADHAGQGAVVGLFVLAAVAQVVVGSALLARPGRTAAMVGMAVNLLAAGAWLGSRTTGLPVIAGPEAVSAAGVATTVAEVAAIAAAGLVLRGPWVSRRRLSPVLVVALVPALVGFAAPSEHHHDAGEVAAGHDHAGEGSHTHAAASKLAADPVFAGADTAHASTQQLQAAKRLIETTRAAVAAKFPDRAPLLAAGYRSIGDGLVTQYDHFIKAEYLDDGRELDPERIESIVMQRTPEGWQVASAMYILEEGKTMADVPDVAGDLAAWHDHQNLCWDQSGLRLAGLFLNGRCVPGGTLRATPPMLHVWLADHACGPFAGIEGHGGECTHGHPTN